MKTTPHKARVGVVRGGPSSEYEVSLKTGANALKHIGARHHVHDILISRDGVWHLDGIAREPHQILRHVDVVFNALHGAYGEDGQIQRVFDTHGIRHIGSGHFASALSMNKIAAKRMLRDSLGSDVAAHDRATRLHHHTHNLTLKVPFRTPLHRELRREVWEEDGGDDEALQNFARFLFASFPQPSVIKPAGAGSSIGVSIVQTVPEIVAGLAKAFEHGDVVMVEEYIKGKEATVGVVEHFRGEPLYALMPVEIVHDSERPFFDYEAKYGGGSKEICPGNFTAEENEALQDLARAVHRVLGLRHYSRIDFMVSPRRGVYFLEANTLPGMTEESLLPKAVAAGGTSMADFFDHLVALGLGE